MCWAKRVCDETFNFFVASRIIFRFPSFSRDEAQKDEGKNLFLILFREVLKKCLKSARKTLWRFKKMKENLMFLRSEMQRKKL